MNGAESDKRVSALFKGRTQVTLREYAQALGYADWDQYPNVMVRKVISKDYKAIRQELNDVLRL